MATEVTENKEADQEFKNKLWAYPRRVRNGFVLCIFMLWIADTAIQHTMKAYVSFLGAIPACLAFALVFGVLLGRKDKKYKSFKDYLVDGTLVVVMIAGLVLVLNLLQKLGLHPIIFLR